MIKYTMEKPRVVLRRSLEDQTEALTLTGTSLSALYSYMIYRMTP